MTDRRVYNHREKQMARRGYVAAAKEAWQERYRKSTPEQRKAMEQPK